MNRRKLQTPRYARDGKTNGAFGRVSAGLYHSSPLSTSTPAWLLSCQGRVQFEHFRIYSNILPSQRIVLHVTVTCAEPHTAYCSFPVAKREAAIGRVKSVT